MATHGHSVVRHLFAGSTALGVLQQSPLPVLMAAV
jgi:nucleotide-binding universal stress UspA family protein